VWFTNHLKVDNTNLSPEQVADKIIEAFGINLKVVGSTPSVSAIPG
jgi:hypothetical protein